MSTNPKQLDDLTAPARIPAATYRLQFNRDFTFKDARETAEYLRDLGITDAYASPIFQAGPESTHGYDVCNFDRLNPALGDRSEFKAFAGRLRELGLGLLLDMVPNHMGASLCNPWWAHVLTHGRQSQFADFFDIDWRPAGSGLVDKVLLPVLEAPYGTVLEQGNLRLVCDEGGFAIAYRDHNFPLAPGSCALLLEQAALTLDSEAQDDSVAKDAHQFAAALKNSGASISALRERVGQWTKASPAFKRALEGACCSFNGQPGQPRSFDRLHALLLEQPYRLAFWKVAADEINYRRFFDVAQLVSLRMERPDVFQAAHALLFELLESGEVTGVRVDHPDGLRDPAHYFERLQAGFLMRQLEIAAGEEREAADEAIVRRLNRQVAALELEAMHGPATRQERDRAGRTGDPSIGSAVLPAWPLYVVAEKILSGDEPLRPDWAVAGSTGYDFLNKVNGLFVDTRNQEPFDALYREFSGNALSFRDAVYAGKKRILEGSLASDLNALAHGLAHVTRQPRYGQDYTFRELHHALTEVLSTFPVYRTYATETSRKLIPLERHYTEQAIAEAKARNPGLDSALLDLIQDLLLLHTPADLDGPATELNRQFALKFQQLSGPATAKGLEDTAFYNYNRLISLNEVGGDAGQFGTPVSSFHQHNLHKAERWAHSLLATATHDTKRGEDTRARINVLSEMPAQWRDGISRWSRLNTDKKASIAGQLAPDPNDEYLLYQTLVGAWPASNASLRDPRHPRGTHDNGARQAAVAALPQRIADYMIKALREAKARTSWTDPNELYETAVRGFATHILDPHASSAFLEDFQPFQQTVSYFGQFNSLSQLLLKIASPGVPDFYQGTELWDSSLVDPDNRRPVDYSLRRRMLAAVIQKGPALLPELVERTHTGEIKLFLMHQALKFRRQNREVFEQGRYLPLEISGPKREHVCAFARTIGGRVVIAAAPRLVFGLMQGQAQAPVGEFVWQDTALELGADTLAGEYKNVLTGERISTLSGDGGPSLRMSAAFAVLPVALLARVAASSRT